MPYVITTRPCAEPPNEQVAVRAEILSRRAVATLEEARDLAATILEGSPAWIGTTYPFNDLPRLTVEAESLTEAGGTIGPLPDGTVIEVQRVAMNWIIGVAEDRGAEFGEDEADADIIDAFNERVV